MSMTGLEPFDTTIQKTNVWLKEVMMEMGTEEKHRAYLALRAVLHTLRDRLTIEEAAELGAQLPMLIRGFYYDGWRPSNQPVKERHKEAFLNRIREYFRNGPDVDAEQVVGSVFRVLQKHIAEGEIKEIRHLLPAEVRDLWPEVIPV